MVQKVRGKWGAQEAAPKRQPTCCITYSIQRAHLSDTNNALQCPTGRSYREERETLAPLVLVTRDYEST